MSVDTKTAPASALPKQEAPKKTEKQNPYKAHAALVATQVTAISSQLEELRKKLKALGENFDPTIVAQITELEMKQQVLKSQKDLNEIFAEAVANKALEGEKDDGRGGGTFQCKTQDQANALAESIIEKYQELGLSCDVTRSEDGSRIVIKVKMPKGFEGKNPLNMSSEELLEIKEAAQKEKDEKKGAEVSVKEHAKEERPSASPKPSNPVPMQLLPGDNQRGG